MTEGFPAGFFDRADPTPDRRFYGVPRLVTHMAEHGAIVADYLRRAGGLIEPEVSLRTPHRSAGDPLWAAVARRA